MNVPDDPFAYLTKITEDDKHVEENTEDFSQCTHKSTITLGDENICAECGEVITSSIILEKDWRSFATKDGPSGQDPTRTFASRTRYKGIEDDIKSLNFPADISKRANEIFMVATKNGEIKYRAYRRKALVLACISEAYKEKKTPINFDRLIEIFSPIERKHAFEGLKILSLKNKRKTTYIKPIDLVDDILDRYGVTKSYKDEISIIYNKIVNRSSILNRSKPQSVAAGLIYYYSLAAKKDIPIKDFSSKIKLSELTINKIAKEISSILRTPNIMAY